MIKFYHFKTFVTSYYFPEIKQDYKFLYDLYGNYGNFFAKIYWWLFRNLFIVRKLFQIENKDLPFPYNKIVSLEGSGAIMAFNLGSPGAERKISILGFNVSNGSSFFAKFSESDSAIKLTKNEIFVYNILKDTGLVPQIIEVRESKDYIFLKVQRIIGKKISANVKFDLVLEILIELKSFHFRDLQNFDNLQTCFSHGDFCPWNMLYNGKGLKVIDWEHSSEKPLGFDLFTFIFQTGFAISNDSVENLLNRNVTNIIKYFGPNTNYIPYLVFFANEKCNYMAMINNSYYSGKYQNLKEFLERRYPSKA